MDVDLQMLGEFLKNGGRIHCGFNLDDQLDALQAAVAATGKQIGFDLNNPRYRETSKGNFRWEYVYLAGDKGIHMERRSTDDGTLTLDDFCKEQGVYSAKDIEGFLADYLQLD